MFGYTELCLCVLHSRWTLFTVTLFCEFIHFVFVFFLAYDIFHTFDHDHSCMYIRYKKLLTMAIVHD